jgi:hypothetical protein
MEMRNRLRKQAPEEAAVAAEGHGNVEQEVEETSNKNPESETLSETTADHAYEAEHTARQALMLTATREELVQTDDGSTFAKVPAAAARRSWTQYRRIVFILGCLMGVLLAWAFRSPDLQLEGLLESVDMADFFDDIRAALPAALPVGIVKEAKEIEKHSRESVASGAFSIGAQMHRDGLSANYTVVMVFPTA